MQALREVAGRDAVMRIIDTDGAGGRLKFDAFSYDPNHYRRTREEINRQLAAAWAGHEVGQPADGCWRARRAHGSRAVIPLSGPRC